MIVYSRLRLPLLLSPKRSSATVLSLFASTAAWEEVNGKNSKKSRALKVPYKRSQSNQAIWSLKVRKHFYNELKTSITVLKNHFKVSFYTLSEASYAHLKIKETWIFGLKISVVHLQFWPFLARKLKCLNFRSYFLFFQTLVRKQLIDKKNEQLHDIIRINYSSHNHNCLPARPARQPSFALKNETFFVICQYNFQVKNYSLEPYKFSPLALLLTSSSWKIVFPIVF